MAYSYSNDPRLKRMASKSPDITTPREPKRPATLENRQPSLSSPLANNNGVSRQNAVVSTPAPVASMSRNAPIVELKMQINLQTVATTNLQFKFDQAETQLKNAEADYQNHASKHHFAAFPAMKETKTAAVERAKRARNSAREPLESARAELRRLIESLVELEQSVKAPMQDAISRAEFEELRRDLSSIKNDVGSLKNSVATMRLSIKDVKEDISNTTETIDSCKANQDIATKSIQELQRTIESHATRMDAAPSNVAATATANADPNILARLDELQEDMEGVENNLKLTQTVVTEHVMKELKGPKDDLVEMKKGLQTTESTIAELLKNLKETGEETASLRETLVTATTVQHTNAKLLDECSSRLDRLEPLLDQTAEKQALAVVQDSLQKLSDRVDSIKIDQEKAKNNPEPRQTNGNGVTPGLSSFQPVLGGDDEDDVNPFHARGTTNGTLRKFDDKDHSHMKHDIEAIKYKVQDLNNRYNNLLTDQLAQNILDNLGVLYPNLKEAERVVKTVQELQARMADITNRTGFVENRVELLDSQTGAALHANGQDMTSLRNNLTVLTGRVDQHATDIAAGRTQLQNHNAAIEKTDEYVRAHENWIQGRDRPSEENDE